MNFGTLGIEPTTTMCSAQHMAQLQQVHGNAVHVVRTVSDSLITPPADALVTCLSGMALAVRSADCAPILLHNAAHTVIAAVHSGRRGTFLNIVAQTVAIMRQLGASDALHAYVGPCISQASYAVGADIVQQAAAAMQPFFNAHTQFNLLAAVTAQLTQLGVLVDLQHYCCTYATPAYASFRRGDAARNWSVVTLVN